MSKHSRKQQPLPRQYSLEDLNARPVTEQDKWCCMPDIRNGEPCSPEDWGYIITLTSVSKRRKSLLAGGYAILRSKKIKGQFLLQIVPCDSDKQYGITSHMKDGCPYVRASKRRKNRPFCNIENLQKRS